MWKNALVLMLLFCLSATSIVSAQAPRPVIIDTDMGSDDWMAILYVLNSPEVAVQAITVNGTGLAYCDAGTRIALGLLELADYADVPVNCGSETPLMGENAFPPEWRTTMESADALGLPEGREAVPGDAVSLFTSVVSESAEPVAVLALGPLTNVGAALQATPALVNQISAITIMGGAVDVEGSLVSEDNSSAEWNIYCDPYAARLVFESGAPVTLVSLDATNDAPVTMDFLARLGEARQTPEAEFVHTMLEGSTDFIESGGYYFWDPLAAAVLLDPDMVTLTDRDVTVVDTPGADNGRTQPVGNGPDIQVATAPDVAAFEAAFIAALNR